MTINALESPKANSSRYYQVAALAGFAYAALILIMWGAFNPYSGLPYETGFPYTSEIASVLGGFLYGADPLRIHTSTFYHLSYLIAEALGIKGSYVPFQVVYAVLWWARGFLVFLILRKFLRQSLTVCYVAGALVVLHASDGALGWVGQLNQFGFIFWMLLAFYLLTLALQAAGRAWAAIFVIGACFCEYMSLWSYESQILLLLVWPLVLLFRWRPSPKLLVVSLAWYSIPAIYIALAVTRYAHSAGQSYQESVMRKGWSLGSLLADWYFNIAASLEFWNWPRGDWKAPQSEAYRLSLIAAIVFIACGIAFIRLTQENRRPNPFVGNIRTWWTLLGVGFVLLALSFPVYLLLDSARGLWRTQFLSGIGAGLVLTGLLGLASYAFVRQAAIALFLILGGVIAFFGTASAIQKSAFHRWIWERHRATIREILQVAPSVKPDTIIVLTLVPKDNDPFGHNMWLDMAIRLAYPDIPVAGIYFYADGTPSPGNNLKAGGDSWKWDGTGFPPVVRATSLADTVVVDYEPSGPGKLDATLPLFLCNTPCATELYRPGSIITGPISPIAKRRYRLN
jgi:hypothetical protein